MKKAYNCMKVIVLTCWMLMIFINALNGGVLWVYRAGRRSAYNEIFPPRLQKTAPLNFYYYTDKNSLHPIIHYDTGKTN